MRKLKNSYRKIRHMNNMRKASSQPHLNKRTPIFMTEETTSVEDLGKLDFDDANF